MSGRKRLAKDPLWLQRSADLRSLVEAGHVQQDPEATVEIAEFFRPLIKGMVRAAPPSERDVLLADLSSQVFFVLPDALRRADDILAYTTSCLRNFYRKELRAYSRRMHYESPLDVETPLPDPAVDRDFEAALRPAQLDEHDSCLAFLDKLFERAHARRSKTDETMVSIIEFRYVNPWRQLNDREVCAILGLSPEDTKTVCEKLSTVRHNPTSKFHVEVAEFLTLIGVADVPRAVADRRTDRRRKRKSKEGQR